MYATLLGKAHYSTRRQSSAHAGWRGGKPKRAWSRYMYVYLHANCRRNNGTADHSSSDRCTRMYMYVYMSLANLEVASWVLVFGLDRVEFMEFMKG